MPAMAAPGGYLGRVDPATGLPASSRRARTRIAYGASARLVGRLAGGVVSLLALHYAARYFGPLGWGQITAALAWVSMLAAIGSPGVATLAMREIARPGNNRGSVYWTALIAAGIVSLGAAVVAGAAGSAIYHSQPLAMRLVLIMLPSIPLSAMFLVAGAALAAVGRQDVRATLDVLSSVALLAATLAVVGTRSGSSAYAALYDASLLVSAALALALSRRRIRPTTVRGTGDTRSFLRTAAPLGQVDILSAVYFRADSLLLFFVKGASALAVYGVAYQAAAFLMSSPTFLTGALLPDYMAADSARRDRLAERALDVMVTVALPLPLFVTLFAKPFIAIIVGDRYAGAAVLLSILSGSILLIFINSFLFQMAVLGGAERRMWKPLAVVTFANLAANGVGIPLFGAPGAAWAMVASELAGVFLYWRVYRTTVHHVLRLGYPLSIAASVCVLGAVCLAIHLSLHVGVGNRWAAVPRGAILLACYGGLVALCEQMRKRRSRLRSLAQDALGESDSPGSVHDG